MSVVLDLYKNNLTGWAIGLESSRLKAGNHFK